MVLTKASTPQAFPRRDAASAALPWLFAVGSCCSHYSLFSAAVSDQAIGPSTAGLCLLMFESSSTPLLHQTHAKKINFSCLSHSMSWNLLVPPSTYPSVGAEHGELCYHSGSADRESNDSTVVLSSFSVNSSSGLCAPTSWTAQEPTYLEKVLF